MVLPRVAWLIALVFAVAACTPTVADPTTTATSPTTASTTTTVAETTSSEPTSTTASTLPPGTEDLPLEVREEISRLIATTESIRELNFLESPRIVIVTADELEQRVRTLIEDQAEDFPADEALYKLLGLLDPDIDLETLLLDLYGEQVAGFYDGEAKELVVPIRAEGFSVAQRATMVHELTHALTDQHFSYDAKWQAMFDEERFDEASAYQALLEGDATLAELFFIRSLSQEEIGEFFAESLEIDTTVLQATPQFIQEALFFPYDSGLGFVQILYSQGGWEEVNRAYLDHPTTTEQVIQPDDFGRDLPLEVTAPEVDLAGYTLEVTSVWGELGFRLMFSQVLGETVSIEAGDGWGGDSYRQWFDGANAAFLLVYEGDTAGDEEELITALESYVTTAMAVEESQPHSAGTIYAGEVFAFVGTGPGQVIFIAADEQAVGETLLSLFGE